MLRHMAASRNQANAKFQIYCSLHELRAQRELCAGLCCSIPACCRPCRTLTTSVWVAERQHTERAEECLCEAATCGWKLHAWLLMSSFCHTDTEMHIKQRCSHTSKCSCVTLTFLSTVCWFCSLWSDARAHFCFMHIFNDFTYVSI